jgi:RNA polymerase sigma-70 factor (ECF subfamily)
MLVTMADLRDIPGPRQGPQVQVDWQARADEAHLVAKCQEGDLGAFETIYRRHSPGVYSLAVRMVGDRAEAEDLLQEIFILAHDKLPSFERRAAFGTWLYRLAVNRCLDHLRSAASRRKALTRSFEESPEPVAVDETTARRLDLERAILQLPPSYRSAFLLHDVEGLGHREVAEILGVAEGTSKALVHKARVKLREHLRTPRQEDGRD